MLSELRKYRIGLAIAHQFMHQLTPELRHAVLGNIGTSISLRVGPEDASYVVREFQLVFEQEDADKPAESSHLYEAIDRWHAELAFQRADVTEL
ncbi:hypothetical protein ACTGJ9_029060 [Bradyrhizobium sp. RDM12]